MRKRFITLLFVLVCAGLLTGCGKSSETAADIDNANSSSEAVT